MSPALRAYLDGLDELVAARKAAGGELSDAEEDTRLDALESLSRALDAAERTELEAELAKRPENWQDP